MASSVQRPIMVVVLLTLAVVVLLLLLANAVGALSAAGDGGNTVMTHRVAAGDTLWDIAADHTDPGDDVRKTVFEIRRASGLEGSMLYPGQVLRIPTG